MSEQFVWVGEENRRLKLYRPCPCGCDSREGEKGVGYISGSNEKGEGVTIWIEDEEVFRRLQVLMGKIAVRHE